MNDPDSRSEPSREELIALVAAQAAEIAALKAHIAELERRLGQIEDLAGAVADGHFQCPGRTAGPQERGK